MDKPLIGISSCLLGNAVRYNGAHKKEQWLCEELGKFVNWHSLCPEVSMGLGVPRESMRLQRLKKGGTVRLLGNQSQDDLTALAKNTTKTLVEQLPKNLNGFILKNRSPSCGLEKVKVYSEKNIPFSDGVGFFAKSLIKRNPDLPIIEEGRLKNLAFREQFLTRVFAHHAISALPAKISELQKFHESYKFVIQAHDEISLRKLGPIAANSKKEKPRDVLEKYKKIFHRALAHPPNIKKRTNVAQHVYGFVKDKVAPKEKANILKNIELYRTGKIPYIALMVLIRHLIEKYEVAYIEKQKLFTPYPENLNLS